MIHRISRSRNAEEENAYMLSTKRRKLDGSLEKHLEHHNALLSSKALLDEHREDIQDSGDEYDSLTYNEPAQRRHLQSDDVENDDENASDYEEMESLGKTLTTEIRVESETGHVEKIELVNFMCHRRLSICFGPNINFVIGRNGSGKSAILTALIVCLGGKASITHRATNLKGFLRAGSNAASILVYLNNHGEDAYCPELYGDTIMVERRINKDGQSNYRICSHSAKLISNKREELSRILDYFNIQVDNPMTFLSQDSARQFLSSSAPQEKYKYFMKGTGLEQISLNYVKIKEKKETIQHIVAQMKQLLLELKENMDKLEVQYRELGKSQHLEQYLHYLKNELVWSLVEEKEKEVKELQGMMQKSQGKVQETVRQTEALQLDMSELQTKMTSLDKESNCVIEQAKIAGKKKRDANRLLESYRGHMAEITAQENEIERSKRMSQKVMNQLQKRIAEEREKTQCSAEAKTQKLMRDIEDLKTKLNKDNTAYLNNRSNRDKYEAKLDQYNASILTLEQKQREVTHDLSILKNRLEHLQLARHNKLRIFGDKIPEVLKAIRSTSSFSYKPVGPIGLHIKLRDLKWKFAMDAVIGAYMESFVVRNFEDQRLLKNILDKYGCNNQIIVLNEEKLYNTSGKEPHERFLTVKRAIECDDDLVMNVLMVQASIERVILIASEHEARSVMFKGSPPQNIDSCVTEDAGILRYQNNSASYFSFIPDPNRRKYFSDIEQQISETEMECARVTQEHEKLAEAIHNSKETQERLKTDLDRTYSDLQKQQALLIDKGQQLMDLEESLRDDPTDVLALEEEITKLNTTLEMLGRQADALTRQKGDLEVTYTPSIHQLNEIDVEIDRLKQLDDDTQVIYEEINEVP
jgi:chromosome segregation ATPase